MNRENKPNGTNTMKKRKQLFVPTRFMLPTSHYDKRRADRAVSFIQSLKHTKGVWAGKPFLLFPWQEQIIRDIFGVVKENGYRQFNTAFVEICKKAGKSELAAAIALYMLCADNEEGAEIYGCANDRHQSSIVFDVARDMCLQSPLLMERIKIIESQKRLVYIPTRSIYQALSSDVASKYGYNVHACIFDELLGQPNRKLFDVMTKGAGAARKQPLNFVITTAGSNKQSICYEVHAKAIDILEGRKKDPTFYPVVYSAPETADWTDPKVWMNANPSLGRTVDVEYYRQRCESAKENPAEEIQFRQFHLCQWTSTTVRWMPMDKWDACEEVFDLDDLEGRACYAGLDLASTSDLTAFVLVFPPETEGEKYIVVPFFWLPEETLQFRVRRDHVMYDVWQKQGFIQTTEGNVVHYGFIEKSICELGERFNIREIAYDRWNASMMVQALQDDGFTMVPFGQGFVSMSAPTKELMRLVLEKSIRHNGHPVLRWNMDNIYVRTDPAGNLKIDKEKSTEKVDGAVALVMALDRAMKNGGGGGSIYDALHEELYGADGQLRDDVHIRLNSYGGSCNAATRMCDDVRAYPGNVHITISGTAASAATVLAMAADNLDMTPGSLFMIHDPSVVAWGNERELMESINLLRACKESIINTYVDRCKKSRQEIAAMMSATTWMDAQSAVAEGFVDAIAESLKPGAVQNSICERQTDEERRAEFRACRDEAEKKVKAWLERRKPHKASHIAQGETSAPHVSMQTSASPLNGKTVPESIPETVPEADGIVPNAQALSDTKNIIVPEACPETTPLVEAKAPIEIKTPVAQLQKRLGLIMPTRR